MTIKNYLHVRRSLYSHSYALSRAFHTIQNKCSDIYMLDVTQPDPTTTDARNRFTTATTKQAWSWVYCEFETRIGCVRAFAITSRS